MSYSFSGSDMSHSPFPPSLPVKIILLIVAIYLPSSILSMFQSMVSPA